MLKNLLTEENVLETEETGSVSSVEEILVLDERGFNIKNHQWIFDRVDGTSKVDPENRPYCRACWVPVCVKCYPGCLEQNRYCESLGAIGFIDPTDYDKRLLLMRVALVSNVISMLLTFVASFAISKNYDILMSLGFSKGTYEINDEHDITIGVGLLAVALKNFAGEDNEVVYDFDELCHVDPDGFFIDQSKCDDCKNISASLVSTVILSIVTSLPSIFTDILRTYPNYDANCQKTAATLIALLSMGSSLYTWQGYSMACFKSFEDFEDMSLNAGPGLILVIAATLIKIVSVTCHLILPTPSITRDHKEQEEYERMT